jgi:hypothetical protein
MRPEILRDHAAASPYAFAARVLGTEPLLVERQPIRPIDGGRSFASTRIDTPLHTDSQLLLGVPPALQILVCIRQAPRGGQSVFVDASQMLRRLERESPPLARDLFEVVRAQRFYFGVVEGPTVALRGGHLAWTVSPVADDALAGALATELRREAPVVHALSPGEALVASNHRMVHGRLRFEGERELVRLLVWLERPLPADPSHVARARTVTPPLAPAVVVRLRAVLAILRGAPPALTAQEAGVDEATLYAWRDAFVGAAIGAPGD